VIEMNVSASRPVADAADEVVRSVLDPEMPYVTLGDLGVVGAVTADEDTGSVHVWLLPTFLGCPATEVIRQDVEAVLIAQGWTAVSVELRFDPPWTPDRITAQGRAKLAAEGIAPPAGSTRGASGPVSVSLGQRWAGAGEDGGRDRNASVRCPQCGAQGTELLSAFGAAPCQELRRCVVCREPFPAIKSDRGVVAGSASGSRAGSAAYAADAAWGKAEEVCAAVSCAGRRQRSQAKVIGPRARPPLPGRSEAAR
jgi:ring-1,2-phenylacetyl-CoA epoxidase subunit PaaD